MIFSTRQHEARHCAQLNGDGPAAVQVCKYPAHFFRFNFIDQDDVTFRLKIYYASFDTFLEILDLLLK